MDEELQPRSVKDRIALLQQHAAERGHSPAADRPPAATSSATTSSLSHPPSTATSDPYGQYSNRVGPTPSPAQRKTILADSAVVARPHSPTIKPAPSPAPAHLGPRSSLEHALTAQLAGTTTATSPSPTRAKTAAVADSTRTASPVREAASPPPLPRRVSPAQARPSRGYTVDSSSSTTRPRPDTLGGGTAPPRLPPRRSSTLDSHILLPMSGSSEARTSTSSSPDLNPPINSFSSSRSLPAPPKSTSSSAPDLPRRLPSSQLEQSTSSASSRASDLARIPPTTAKPRPRSRTRPTPSSYDPLQSTAVQRPLESNGSSEPTAIRPIDPRARKRYERLFDQCVSVSPSSSSNVTADDERAWVEGEVVRMVWERSRLSRESLRRVWNQVSPHSARLDKEGFVRGMWMIDEELRRHQSRRE
ncbi:uncharacterized protein JCM15063_001484 [Sporobolomyces koalae]|uniref:uncharacterized protein n=1 Tax=Sporobolomyces koalae TaxID=500713 RepID=UPI00316E5D8C